MALLEDIGYPLALPGDSQGAEDSILSGSDRISPNKRDDTYTHTHVHKETPRSWSDQMATFTFYVD